MFGFFLFVSPCVLLFDYYYYLFWIVFHMWFVLLYVPFIVLVQWF